MEITKKSFGTDGRGNDIELVILKNAHDTQAHISTLGANLVSFLYKDKAGIQRDVVLGHDTAEDYLKNTCYFGATVGRCANRIAGAKLTINGTGYTLEKNDGDNNLHSGSNGMGYKVWEIESMDEAANSVTMKCFSADLEQGFPGNMTAKVTYALGEDDALSITYEAVSDKDTIANFTNHSYFNLGGQDSGTVNGQKLKVYAKEYTPVAPVGLIPTGEILPVEGTPFDFTEWKEIGKDMESDFDQLKYTGGYDHNFVLENNGELKIMAEAVCEETGIHLKAYTDCPGVQFYAGNFVGGQIGKGGAVYAAHQGFCLESQYYPDSVNKPAFETPLLKAGDVYTSRTIYQLCLD